MRCAPRPNCSCSAPRARSACAKCARLPCCAEQSGGAMAISIAPPSTRAAGNVMPDLTIVIDVPEDVSLARLKTRASDLPDRMERENVDFYKKVREGYLVLAKGMPERFIVVDGTKSEDVIEKKIWSEVQSRLK